MAQSEYEPCGCDPDGLPIVTTKVGGRFKVVCPMCGKESDHNTLVQLDFARDRFEVCFKDYPNLRALAQDPEARKHLKYVDGRLVHRIDK